MAFSFVLQDFTKTATMFVNLIFVGDVYSKSCKKRTNGERDLKYGLNDCQAVL